MSVVITDSCLIELNCVQLTLLSVDRRWVGVKWRISHMILTKEVPSTWRQVRTSSTFLTVNGVGSNMGLLGDTSHNCFSVPCMWWLCVSRASWSSGSACWRFSSWLLFFDNSCSMRLSKRRNPLGTSQIERLLLCYPVNWKGFSRIL
jgi:hypothetical protein